MQTFWWNNFRQEFLSSFNQIVDHYTPFSSIRTGLDSLKVISEGRALKGKTVKKHSRSNETLTTIEVWVLVNKGATKKNIKYISNAKK